MLENIIECCANSIKSALTAIQAGANRIELCANLEEGGITPKFKDIIKLREFTKVNLHILILPNPNKFIYNQSEFNKIINDIKRCKEIGCNGIVIGALNQDYSINIKQTKKMVKTARPMKVTFHRSFDVANKLKENIEDVIACGCDYLLTSGQAPSVEQGIENLKTIIKLSNHRIKVLAGGGVNHKNIKFLYEIGIREFHLSGTKRNNEGVLETTFKNISQAVKELQKIEKNIVLD